MLVCTVITSIRELERSDFPSILKSSKKYKMFMYVLESHNVIVEHSLKRKESTGTSSSRNPLLLKQNTMKIKEQPYDVEWEVVLQTESNSEEEVSISTTDGKKDDGTEAVKVSSLFSPPPSDLKLSEENSPVDDDSIRKKATEKAKKAFVDCNIEEEEEVEAAPRSLLYYFFLNCMLLLC